MINGWALSVPRVDRALFFLRCRGPLLAAAAVDRSGNVPYDSIWSSSGVLNDVLIDLRV